MSSTRTIRLGKGELKWYTPAGYSLRFNMDDIKNVYKTVVKPNIKVSSRSEIRKTVSKIVEDHLLSGEATMLSFVNLIMAIRLTEISEKETNEDGTFKVFLRRSYFNEDLITFKNIVKHINRHCTKLHKFCFVCFTGFSGDFAISYTTGEAHDRKDFFLDKKEIE